MPRQTNPLPSSTPDFPSVIRTHSDQLAKIKSDKGANDLFLSAIGPALQMGDVVGTLKVNPFPARLAKDLLVPDLTAAVLRLMGSLAVWDIAVTVRQAVEDQQLELVTERLLESPESRAWLDQQTHAAWHDSLNQLVGMVASPEWAKEKQEESASLLLVTVRERVGPTGSVRHAGQLPRMGSVTELERSGARAPRPGQTVRDLAVDHS